MPPLYDLKDKIHKRLRIRLVIYFIISIVVLGISLFHIIKDHANILLSFLGLVFGMIVGVVFSRIFKISWEEKAAQVIGKFDAIGIFFLGLYILFEVYREQIVERFVSGPSVVAVSFAVLAGLMYGRVLGIRGKVREVFEEQGIQ